MQTGCIAYTIMVLYIELMWHYISFIIYFRLYNLACLYKIDSAHKTLSQEVLGTVCVVGKIFLAPP